jgi:hypothetical protein
VGNITKKKTAIVPPKEKKVQIAVERRFQKGDLLIDNDGRLLKVGKCTKKGYELLHKWQDEWTHYGSHKWEDHETRYIKLEKSLEEYEKEVIQGLATGFEAYTQEPAMSNSTDLVAASDKTMAKSAKRVLEEKTKHLAILSRTLERMKDQLDVILSDFREKVKAVSRVVDIIEIYLGVHEHIVQIQEGESAPVDSPICFRQLVLHMDEEVGEDIDWKNVEDFDKYVREHTDQVLPEPKGVVVLRPRRSDRKYSDNPLENLMLNQGNKETYILIRNGDNLFRIYTPLLIYPHLFPSKEEMKELMDTTDKWGYDKERAEDQQLAYKRNILLLQGLMERTQVFAPVPPGLNLLRSDTYGKHLRFIYDGSNLLPSGRLAWDEYLKQQNAKLQRGNRVYFCGFPWGLFSSEGKSDRDEEAFRYPTGAKHRPPAGVYNIREVRPTRHYGYSWSTNEDTQYRKFLLNHNPKDEIYDWKRRVSGRERMMAVAFYLHERDNFFINYDDLSMDDIEFYLNDRVNRVDYKEMLPIFRGLKKMRLKELEWEKGFVRFMMDRIDHPDRVLLERTIWQAIEWWKHKVIEKRALKKEDAKAVRMIEQRVRRMLQGDRD